MVFCFKRGAKKRDVTPKTRCCSCPGRFWQTLSIIADRTEMYVSGSGCIIGLRGYSVCRSFQDLCRARLRWACLRGALALLEPSGVRYLHSPSSFPRCLRAGLRAAVIAVARLGNQILFIASRLFQHIPMIINRGTGVV